MDQNTCLDTLSATQCARRRLTQEAIDHLREPLSGGGVVLTSPDQLTAADMLFHTAKLLVLRCNSPQGAGLLTRTLAQGVPVKLNAQVTTVRPDPGAVTVS
ncbi:FAD-dependent oxidoreductase [Streptomyces huasconensis]|uniref:FAD-dependent oxidoreductase n=1 Tax=Streptomyces huasconensis TaxID=1854574 RepID=UPI0036F6C9D2